jgi:hypothetical protein
MKRNENYWQVIFSRQRGSRPVQHKERRRRAQATPLSSATYPTTYFFRFEAKKWTSDLCSHHPSFAVENITSSSGRRDTCFENPSPMIGSPRHVFVTVDSAFLTRRSICLYVGLTPNPRDSGYGCYFGDDTLTRSTSQVGEPARRLVFIFHRHPKVSVLRSACRPAAVGPFTLLCY